MFKESPLREILTEKIKEIPERELEKLLHVVKKMGLKVDKLEEMVGSYGPNAQPYTKTFSLEEAPSGMLARGSYAVKSRFIDVFLS